MMNEENENGNNNNENGNVQVLYHHHHHHHHAMHLHFNEPQSVQHRSILSRFLKFLLRRLQEDGLEILINGLMVCHSLSLFLSLFFSY